MTQQPSKQPDRGYMGDRARGASLGRASCLQVDPDSAPKIHLAEIRLDSGGYDPGGAYWGFGGWLWEAWTDDGAFYMTGRVYSGTDERKEACERLRAQGNEWPGSRAIDRETAKQEIREVIPNARFYR